MYKRVLLKLSGEALAGGAGKGFDPETLKNLAIQLKAVSQENIELAIVVGGGNFVRGKILEQIGIERTQADYMGMLATVMNALAVQSALEQIGVPTRVQSAIEMSKICEPFIIRRAMRHLEKGRVVIFAAGVGSPYFSTDTCAALRASEIGADVILMSKNGVDGVYSADPKKDASAKKYEHLTYMDLLSKNLQVMDPTAVTLCMENGIDLVVFNMNEEQNILRAIRGEKIGTIITKEES